MLPAILASFAFCPAITVLGTHRIGQHFIRKDLAKWFRTVVGPVFKAFAIFLFLAER
jgi:threonine/homoserine/homoserine lactone efflux protein